MSVVCSVMYTLYIYCILPPTHPAQCVRALLAGVRIPSLCVHCPPSQLSPATPVPVTEGVLAPLLHIYSIYIYSVSTVSIVSIISTVSSVTLVPEKHEPAIVVWLHRALQQALRHRCRHRKSCSRASAALDRDQ